MNSYKKLIVVLLIAATTFASSCTKDFEEINTDPNRIDAISPGTLLNPILYEVAGFNMGQADNITFDFMQVALNYPSPTGGLHRFDVQENIGNGTWNTYYRWLNNVKEMYNASVKSNDPNYQAIAITLNAWIYANLTDCFGDVPMTEAVKGDEGILRPRFNTQKEIYPSLLNSLDTANTLYTTTKPMIFGTDILYGNSITKWRKFTNSLRMRLLLRVSNRAEMNSWAQLRTIIDNPTANPVFTSNADGAVLQLTGITPLVSPWGRPIDFTTFRAAGKFFIDSLNEMSDPRREKWASPARASDGTTVIGYRGIPSGYTGSESQFGFIPSNLNQALVTGGHIVPIMPYAEVELIKAEVEHHFENNTAAKAAYEKGVKASVEQWGAVLPATYFENPAAAYNDTLSRIMLQKYYALFFVGYQQWFEYRRTGLPELPVADGMLNNKEVPSRFFYPIPVRTNNPQNYQEAVKTMGPDQITTKVWWDQ